MRKIIIYVSGIDGCGKTTQAKILVEELRTLGYDAIYSWLRWEPSIANYIKFLRRFKSKNHASASENNNRLVAENLQETEWLCFKRRLLANRLFRRLWLFYASIDYYLTYRKRFKTISSDIVVVDRYFYDFMIDQAVNLGLAADKCHEFGTGFFLSRFRKPDVSIIIDLPPDEGYKRKNDGTSVAYLETRKCFYDQLFPSNEAIHLNGSGSIDDLASQIKLYVIENIG